MDLTRFRRVDLLNVCKEFGITIGSTAKKSLVIEAILNAELDEDDINETLSSIETREKEEKEQEKLKDEK